MTRKSMRMKRNDGGGIFDNIKNAFTSLDTQLDEAKKAKIYLNDEKNGQLVQLKEFSFRIHD